MPSDFLTRKQVAERLGISQRTLAAWAKKNIGPPAVRLNTNEVSIVFRRRVGDTVKEYPRLVASGPVRYSVAALAEWEAGLRAASGE